VLATKISHLAANKLFAPSRRKVRGTRPVSAIQSSSMATSLVADLFCEVDAAQHSVFFSTIIR